MKTSLQMFLSLGWNVALKCYFLNFFKLKVIVHPKNENCHPLLTLKLFHTWVSLFLLLNTKDILKNVGNQAAGSHWQFALWNATCEACELIK